MKTIRQVSTSDSGFSITASDTLDIKDDPANYYGAEAVYLHNNGASDDVRVMPAANKEMSGFTMTGSSGTANITIKGTAYLATYSSSLATTITNFITSHQATLTNLGVTLRQPSGSAVLVIEGVTPGQVSIANVSGNLNGTVLSRTPITIYINQGTTFPLAVSRVYASTPTAPSTLVGLFSIS